jgi:hypothetical protein
MVTTLAAQTFSHYAPVGILILMAVGFAVTNLVLTNRG